MSSTHSVCLCVAVLVVLFAAFSNVHSWNNTAPNRPRSRDSRSGQRVKYEDDTVYKSPKRHHPEGRSREDGTDKSTLSANVQRVADSLVDVSGTNVSSVSRIENVTESASELFGTNVSSMLQRENKTYLALDAFFTNISSMSQRENVTDSTLDLLATNISSMSQREIVTDSTLELFGTNISSMSQREIVTDSTLDLLATNISSMSQREIVTDATLDLLATNISNVSQRDNVTDSVLDIFVINISNMSQRDNATDTTSVASSQKGSSTIKSESEHRGPIENYFESVQGNQPDNSTNSSNIDFLNYSNTNLTSTSHPLDANSNNFIHPDISGRHLPLLEEDYMDYGENESLHSSAEDNSTEFDQFIDSGCVTCRIRSIDRHYRILQFKNHILNSLHLTNLPNITGVPIPKFPALTHLYEMDADLMNDSPGRNGHGANNVDYDDDFVSKTERVFVAAKEGKNKTDPPGVHRPIKVQRHAKHPEKKQQNIGDKLEKPGNYNLRRGFHATVLDLFDRVSDSSVTFVFRDRFKPELCFILDTQSAPLALHLNLTNTVYFPPAVQLFTSEIKSAYMWFYIQKHHTPPQYVSIERILPQSKPGRAVITKKVYSLKLSKEKAFGWKRVDLQDTLRQWIKHPMTNFGLLIKAEDIAGNNLIVLPSAPDVDKGYEPWLDTKITEPKHNVRRRRSESLMCVENSTDTRCCRHPLLVGFAEFGWDWIIAPTHVNADYCTGECRMTMQDHTPYSWVNQQMTGTNSCCTPTKLSPLPLLYFDDSNNIVYQILQNMKVEKCGCA